MAHTKILLVANWKMYPQSIQEARTIERRAEAVLKNLKHITCVICPPAVFVADIARAAIRKKIVRIGVQNVHAEHEGAHTGDISAAQAHSVGAQYAIIGHAERRALGETDAECAKKVFMALTTGLIPILCVGEKERDTHGQFLKVVSAQITEGMSLVPQHLRGRVIIAYEPVYAIGAPKPPQESDIHHMVLSIRKTLTQSYGAPVARNVSILYGGAVDASSAPQLLQAIPELHGFLVGRASVDMQKWSDLITSLS
jgi:triosephosphate isomerase